MNINRRAAITSGLSAAVAVALAFQHHPDR
jgi:hypothetical protein